MLRWILKKRKTQSDCKLLHQDVPEQFFNAERENFAFNICNSRLHVVRIIPVGHVENLCISDWHSSEIIHSSDRLKLPIKVFAPETQGDDLAIKIVFCFGIEKVWWSGEKDEESWLIIMFNQSL